MKKQRGFNIVKSIFWTVLLVVAVSLAMKIVPAFLEYNNLKKMFDSINNDKSLVNASPKVVKESLKKQAGLNNLTYDESLIDLDYDDEKRPMLSIAYDKRIHLLSNISVEFHFETTPPAQAASNPLKGAMDTANKMNEKLQAQEKALGGN